MLCLSAYYAFCFGLYPVPRFVCFIVIMQSYEILKYKLFDQSPTNHHNDCKALVAPNSYINYLFNHGKEEIAGNMMIYTHI